MDSNYYMPPVPAKYLCILCKEIGNHWIMRCAIDDDTKLKIAQSTDHHKSEKCNIKMGLIFVTIIIILLYSPTIKQPFDSLNFFYIHIPSIDFQTATLRVLQHLHVIPMEIIYCDRYPNGDNINGDNNECRPCPLQAICANGIFLYCLGDKQLIDGKCKYDQNEINKLEKQMKIYSISLLSSRCGQYECQKYWLYNKLYSIDKKNNNIIFDKALSEEELATELAVTFELDSTCHLFSQVFEKFTKSIKVSNKILPLDTLQYDRNIGYYSDESSNSLICHLIIFLSDNWMIITTVICVALSVSLYFGI